jgi:AcrR family transcriptional regulator
VARPLSEDKRTALLDAATRIVSTLGTGATTAAIAKEAGVATGSLFNYYSTKDALLNALYVKLNYEIADSLLPDYPVEAALRDRAWYVWNRYIAWALQFPEKRRASDQLSLYCRISPEAVAHAADRLGPINGLVQECIPEKSPISAEFGTGLIIKLGQLTIDFAEREPDRKEHYTVVGFNAYWRALSG